MWKYLLLMYIFVSANADKYSENISSGLVKLINEKILDITKNIHGEIPEDAFLNITELITKYGYPVEVHEVETEDGYLLTMHRIPNGKSIENAHKTPVLLMHGLSSSSVDWLVNGPNNSLVYMLADRGYDVWMGNARGNRYSRKHKTLNPDIDQEFWKFSWDQIGYYDTPTMITHILETTGKSKLHYVGYSQGGTAFFVMASEKPEFNEKILLMQGLAPGCYTTHAKSPLFSIPPDPLKIMEEVLDLLGIDEILTNLKWIHSILRLICAEDSPLLSKCETTLSILLENLSDQIDAEKLPIYVSHTPAGIAKRQLIHYNQLHNSEKFRKYDFGTAKNMETYGSETPPDYNLTKITAPVFINYGDGDLYVDPMDIQRLFQELGNPVGKYLVPLENFGHFDFALAKDAYKLVYEPVIALMDAYNQF